MFDYKCRSAIQLLSFCLARFEWVIQLLCRSIEGANRKTRFLSVQAPFHGYALFRSPLTLTKSYIWHHSWGSNVESFFFKWFYTSFNTYKNIFYYQIMLFLPTLHFKSSFSQCTIYVKYHISMAAISRSPWQHFALVKNSIPGRLEADWGALRGPGVADWFKRSPITTRRLYQINLLKQSYRLEGSLLLDCMTWFPQQRWVGDLF